MNKRFLPLVITAGLVSALLLFAGTALLDRISPVYASRLPALLSGGASSSSSDNLAGKTDKNNSILVRLLGGASSDDGSATPVATLSVTDDSTGTPAAGSTPGASSTPASSSTPRAGSTAIPQSTPAAPPQGTSVSIADLIANPSLYRGALVSLSGIATSLNGDKILLNDGTGQIVVDLEDDLMKVITVSGSQVTILGTFKVGNSGVQIDACVYNGSQIDNCENEHINGDDKGGSDDKNGSGSDDGSNHDSNDDNGGISSGSDDGSSHDSNDDNSNSGSSSDDGSSHDSNDDNSNSGSGSDDGSNHNSNDDNSNSGSGSDDGSGHD